MRAARCLGLRSVTAVPVACRQHASRTGTHCPLLQSSASFLLPKAAFTGALSAQQRCFWNPFASFAKNSEGVEAAVDPVAQRNASQHAKIVEEAHRDADQQNEQLLGACLDLLEMCGGDAAGSAPSDQLDRLSRDTLWTLVDVMLHDHRRSPAEQFDLVYGALCLPVAHEVRDVHRCLIVLLHSVLPEPLYCVFQSVNLFVISDDEQSQQQREALVQFVHAVLGELRAPPGLEDEEVLAVYMDDVKKMFPALVTCPAWAAVEKDASTIALKAKLFALLGRLCSELDEDRSGKVKLEVLRSTAQRVLGKEQAAQLLEGAQPDKEGKIAYPQLAALLTRPPPKREAASK